MTLSIDSTLAEILADEAGKTALDKQNAEIAKHLKTKVKDIQLLSKNVPHPIKKNH